MIFAPPLFFTAVFKGFLNPLSKFSLLEFSDFKTSGDVSHNADNASNPSKSCRGQNTG